MMLTTALPITLLCAAALPAQQSEAVARPDLLLAGARVLDPGGAGFLAPCSVLVRGGRIAAVGDDLEPGERVERVEVAGAFVIPGLIDLHSHLLLHPYDEATWDDQVLRESLELRTIRGTVAAAATLRAGFTTLRDLGTEGAGFADVALRDAIAAGIVHGPRVLAATRAIVATGCYGPSGFDPRWSMPVGAQAADGEVGVRVAVREQVAAGADWIKVYADYRRRPGDRSTPTFTAGELAAIVDEATSAGIPVAAHASTDEAIRRAVLAGVRTIEHGYEASAATLELMRERGVVLCPTLAANEAIVRYRGGGEVIARRLNIARVTFRRALQAGVTIACGSDVGVFAHGDNAREIELMVDYGMSPADAIRAATTVAASVLGRDDLGVIAPGKVADLVVLDGDPLEDPRVLRAPRLVVKGGAVVR